LLDTAEFLLERCCIDGAFFQDMIHSGLNAYLTLHLAQVLLRAGDPRHFDLLNRVCDLASPTGQWPEAVHPRTGGGCMGDGQHGWAAAEWVMMMRSLFMREEDDRLVFGSGIPAEWLDAGGPLRCGPTATPYGPVEVNVRPGPGRVTVDWEAEWRGEAPAIEVSIPGIGSHTVARGAATTSVTLGLEETAS
jgi:hypothetical protein